MTFTNLPIHIWLFGNYTLDTKIFSTNDQEIVKQSYGGSVNFDSLVIKNFFSSCLYQVFSIGYPLNVQKEFNFSNGPNFVQDSDLTHYLLDYRSEPRKLKLEFFPAKQIDLPEVTEDKPQVIMITPVYHEVPEELVSKLREYYPTAMISCDPQGWCRDKNENNEIIIKQWIPTSKLLSALSIIKLSADEVKSLSLQELEKYIMRITDHEVFLVITGGENGSICFSKDIFPYCLYIPVKKVPKIVDVTGAGDVWLLTFTLIYYSSKNIEQSLASASILSSLKIQAEGLNFAHITDQELKNEIFLETKKIHSIEFSKGIQKVFSFNKEVGNEK